MTLRRNLARQVIATRAGLKRHDVAVVVHDRFPGPVSMNDHSATQLDAIALVQRVPPVFIAHQKRGVVGFNEEAPELFAAAEGNHALLSGGEIHGHGREL